MERRILLVEDDLELARSVSDYFREQGHTVHHCVDGVNGLASACESEYQVIILDRMLPQLDGLNFVRKLRERAMTTPVIYLTTMGGIDDRVEGLEAGGDDYLAKPVDPSELRARIMAGKRILDLQQSLRFTATHDFLTSLLNRSEILAAIHREFSRGGREGKPATVIMADIDHFKRINDSMGHAAGDEVLKEVSRRLKSDLRPYDFVGRYGGEEFLIILPGCELTVGARRADEIRNLVSKDPIYTPFGTTSATVSLGVTATSPGHDQSVSDLLREADVSMYAAKKNGRNRVELFSAKARQAGAGES